MQQGESALRVVPVIPVFWLSFLCQAYLKCIPVLARNDAATVVPSTRDPVSLLLANNKIIIKSYSDFQITILRMLFIAKRENMTMKMTYVYDILNLSTRRN